MKKVLLSILACSVAVGTAQMAQAAFVEDSNLTVEAKGAYINSDNRSGSYDSKELATGLLATFESGFTDGSKMAGFGFGLDAFVAVGMKLDGSVKKDSLGVKLPQTGLLPDNQKEFGKLGLTAKVKYSESVLTLGTLRPDMPVLVYNNDRLTPQLFSGVNVSVNEIENLSLTFGQIREVNHRNSQDYEKMSVELRGDILSSEGKGNRFNYAGGTYQLNDSLSGTYFYSNLEDYYKQHFIGLKHSTSFYEGQTLTSELRYFKTDDDGDKRIVTTTGDSLENKTFSAMVSYDMQGHNLAFAYQKASGNNGFVKIEGSDSYLHNKSIVSDFANKGEKSWQVRYGYDFAGLGLNGLTFDTSYVKGTNVDTFGAKEGREWERNTNVSYLFQDGAAKDLSLTLKNATHRSNFDGKTDEIHLVVSYPLSI